MRKSVGCEVRGDAQRQLAFARAACGGEGESVVCTPFLELYHAGGVRSDSCLCFTFAGLFRLVNGEVSAHPGERKMNSE